MIYRALVSFLVVIFLAGCGGGAVSPSSERSGRVFGEDAPSLARIAAGLEAGDDVTGALRLYRKALSADPDHLPARLGEIRMLVRAGAIDEAATLLNALDETVAGTAAVLLTRADVEWRVGSLERSLAALEGGERASSVPLPADLQLLKGRLLVANNRFGEAITLWDDLYKSAQLRPEIVRDLSLAMAALQGPAAATAIMEERQTALATTEAERLSVLVHILGGDGQRALDQSIQSLTVQDRQLMRNYIEEQAAYGSLAVLNRLYFGRP